MLRSAAIHAHVISIISNALFLHTLVFTLLRRYARAGLSQANVDLFEINEAFAAGRLAYVLSL